MHARMYCSNEVWHTRNIIYARKISQSVQIMTQRFPTRIQCSDFSMDTGYADARERPSLGHRETHIHTRTHAHT